MSHSTDVAQLLTSVCKHFADINRDPDLNDDDKKRLKEFYVEELITPKARRLLLEHFPDEFKGLDPAKRPDRRRRVWIDPQSDALAFLSKDKTPLRNIEAQSNDRAPRGLFARPARSRRHKAGVSESLRPWRYTVVSGGGSAGPTGSLTRG